MKIKTVIEKLQKFVESNPEAAEVNLAVYMEHLDQVIPIGFYTRDPEFDDYGEFPSVVIETAV